MTARRFAYRLALREQIASRQRTALILVLIALPIAGLSAAATILNQPPVPSSIRLEGGTPIISVTPGAELGVITIIAAFASLLVCLLAGSAFLVGALARRRQLATIVAIGGPHESLVAITSATGPLLGAIGGLIGASLGAGAGSLMVLLSRGRDGTTGIYVPWGLLSAIIALAVLAGWVAAAIPARSASKIDIVAALRGEAAPSETPGRSRLLWLVVAVIGVTLIVAAGVASIRTVGSDAVVQAASSYADLAVVIGALLTIVGLVRLSPLLLLWLSHASGHISVGARIGMRDAYRNQARSTPVVATITGTTFVAVFIMVTLASSQAATRMTYPYQTMPGLLQTALAPYPGDDDTTLGPIITPGISEDVLAAAVTRAYEDTLPINAISVIHTAEGVDGVDVPNSRRCSIPPPEDEQQMSALSPDPNCRDSYATAGLTPGFGIPALLVVADIADLAIILDDAPTAASARSLQTGGAVSLHKGFVGSDEAVELVRSRPLGNLRLSAVIQEPAHVLPYGLLVSPDTAERLKLDFHPTQVLASLSRPASIVELTALSDELSAIPGVSGLTIGLENGPPTDLTWAWVIVLCCGLATAGASSVALALARFESLRDVRVLNSIGASPRTRNAIAGWQGLALCVAGTALGGSVALVSGYALNIPGSGSVFDAPWPAVLATIFLIPWAVAGVAWILASQASLEPRRESIPIG